MIETEQPELMQMEQEQEQGARETTPKALKKMWKRVKRFVDIGKKERNLLKRLHFKQTREKYHEKRKNKVTVQYKPNMGTMRKSRGLRRCASLHSHISQRLISDRPAVISQPRKPQPPPLPEPQPVPVTQPPAQPQPQSQQPPVPEKKEEVPAQEPPTKQPPQTLPVKAKPEPRSLPQSPPPPASRKEKLRASARPSPATSIKATPLKERRKGPLSYSGSNSKLLNKGKSTVLRGQSSTFAPAKLQKQLLTLVEAELYKEKEEKVQLKLDYYSRIAAREPLRQVRTDFRYESPRMFQTASVLEGLPGLRDLLRPGKSGYEVWENMLVPPRYSADIFLVLYPCWLQEHQDLPQRIAELANKVSMAEYYQLDLDLKTFRSTVTHEEEVRVIDETLPGGSFWKTYDNNEEDTERPEGLPPSLLSVATLCKALSSRLDTSDLRCGPKPRKQPQRSRSPRNNPFPLDTLHAELHLRPLQHFVALSYPDDQEECLTASPDVAQTESERLDFTKLYARYFDSLVRRMYKDGNSHTLGASGTSPQGYHFAARISPTKFRLSAGPVNYERLRQRLRNVHLETAIPPTAGASSDTTRDRRLSMDILLEPFPPEAENNVEMQALAGGVDLKMEPIEIYAGKGTPRMETVDTEFMAEIQTQLDSFDEFIDNSEYNEEMSHLPMQIHAYSKLQPMLDIAKMRPENRAHIVQNERITAPYIFEESSKLKYQFSFAPEEVEVKSADSNSDDENVNVIAIPATAREGTEGTDEEDSVEDAYFSSYMYNPKCKERMKFYIMKIRGNYKATAQCCIEEEDESDDGNSVRTGRSRFGSNSGSDEKSDSKRRGPSTFKVPLQQEQEKEESEESNSGSDSGKSGSSSGSGKSSRSSSKSGDKSSGSPKPQILLPPAVQSRFPVTKIVINGGDGPMPEECSGPADGQPISTVAETAAIARAIGSPPKTRGAPPKFKLNVPMFIGQKQLDPASVILGSPRPNASQALTSPRGEMNLRLPEHRRALPHPPLVPVPVPMIGKVGRRGTELNLVGLVRKHLANDQSHLSPTIKKKNSVLVQDPKAMEEPVPKKRRARFIILTRSNVQNPAKLLFGAIRRMQINEVTLAQKNIS